MCNCWFVACGTYFAALVHIISDFFSPLSSHLLGLFIYPLEENSIVVGFESMISSQIITLQIKDKAKIEDCYLDYSNTSNGALQGGSGKVESSQINFCYCFFVSISAEFHV